MSTWFETKEPSSFQLALHHFNPPPKESSKERYNEVLSAVGKYLGG
jgi:hypothetical protein